jgi:hypothetical protein
MIRFRNPSSSLETMLASFDELFSELKDRPYFNNDDIAAVLAKANLMASSGFTGDTALAKGANKDRSRDKTYNNAKMFAETFRLLGLISIVNNVSSNYRFTYIGEHMTAPNSDKKSLIEQCVLGINNPNKVIDVSYHESVRFFSCVLKAMDELDGYICRDEMILGPMCVNDNDKEFAEMINHIRELRESGSFSKLQNELSSLAKSLQSNKKGGMSVTSVQNCTRFPISVLKYCGWVTSENKKYYGRSVKFMKLTAHGNDTVRKLRGLKDIRLEYYETRSLNERNALIRLGTYAMLGRANFDLAKVKRTIEDDRQTCAFILGEKDILFSPYQTLELNTVNSAMGLTYDSIIQNDNHSLRETGPHYGDKKGPDILDVSDIYLGHKTSIKSSLSTDNVEKYTQHVKNLYREQKNIRNVVRMIVEEHAKDDKDPFYSLVETLFRIIGVDCHKSRDGVIGERWDAMIRDKKNSIPIEIKSPRECEHLSLKAIRQALENKIILLSRKTYPTTATCSSYAVGYYAPNDRAEISALIADIKKTYGYKIAVFDIESLIKASVNIILLNKGININELYTLEGIVDVKDINS